MTGADDAVNDAYCTDPFYSYLTTPDGRCLVASSAKRSELGSTVAGDARWSILTPIIGPHASAWRGVHFILTALWFGEATEYSLTFFLSKISCSSITIR